MNTQMNNKTASQFFPEASLIDTTDGMQFKVYSNVHPPGFVIAKPKYIPDDLVSFKGLKKRFIFEKCMTRFNLFTSKEIAKFNLDNLKSKYPEYFYDCKKHSNWFLGVPVGKIKTVHDTQAGFREFMKVPDSDLDVYLKDVRGFANLLIKSGVSPQDIGISHSTLMGNYTLGKSDIDILIFGKKNGWKAVHFLETASDPALRWKTKEDWAKYFKDRVVSKNYSVEQYVFNMERKRDDGFYNDNVFSIFVIETPDEQWYNLEQVHTPMGVAKVRAKVVDAYNSIVRPGYYGISNVQLIEGQLADLAKLKRIVTWARPFTLQAKEGEAVEACGLLEHVTSEKDDFYQLVLGYFDTYTSERGEQEYLKVLQE